MRSVVLFLIIGMALYGCRKQDIPEPMPDLSLYTPNIVGGHLWRGTYELHDQRANPTFDTFYEFINVFAIHALNDSTIYFVSKQDCLKYSAANDSEIIYGKTPGEEQVFYNYLKNTLTYYRNDFSSGNYHAITILHTSL